MKHLSAGDLLRAEVASGSEVGEQCQTLMKEGKLVPTEVTLGLIRKAMSLADQKTFIIDGFPRAVDQGEAFEAAIKPCEFVLFLDCPKETMQERLLKRGETSGRADDNLETIAKRFDTFMEVSMPVMDHFADKVHKVSSVPAPDEVFAEVCKVFEAQGIEPVAAAAEAAEEAAPVAEAEEAAPVAEVEEAEAPAAVQEEAEPPAAVEEEAEAPAVAEEEAEAPAVVEEDAEAPAAVQEKTEAPAAAKEEAPSPATPAKAVPAPEPVSVPSQLHERAPREPISLVPPAGKPRERFSDYVTAHGVEKLLRDSMRKLNDARPEDPAKYLAEYFSAALA